MPCASGTRSMDEFMRDCHVLFSRLRNLIMFHSRSSRSAKEHHTYLSKPHFKRQTAQRIWRSLPLGPLRNQVTDMMKDNGFLRVYGGNIDVGFVIRLGIGVEDTRRLQDWLDGTDAEIHFEFCGGEWLASDLLRDRVCEMSTYKVEHSGPVLDHVLSRWQERHDYCLRPGEEIVMPVEEFECLGDSGDESMESMLEQIEAIHGNLRGIVWQD